MPRSFPLYKYRSLKGEGREHSRRAIVELELYLAPLSSFNDPFEFLFNVTADGTAADWQSLLATIRSGPVSQSEAERDAVDTVLSVGVAGLSGLAAQFPSYVRRRLELEGGVLSLSAIPDHILMWSHYADMHRGICLVLDPVPLADLVDELGPVVYTDTPPSLDTFAIRGPADFPEALLRTKARVWEYEKEWRAIRLSGGPGPLKVPPSTLRGVILGHRMADGDAQLVQAWAASSPAHPVVYSAQADQHRYGLSFLPALGAAGEA